MMILEDHSCKSGFLLLEVLLAIALAGAFLSTVFFMQNGALRILDKYSTRLRVSFAMKNFLTEKIWKSLYEKKQEDKAEQKDKAMNLTLKYIRRKVKSESPLFRKKVAEKQLNHLYVQEVETNVRGRIEKMVSFLYKFEAE